MTSSLGRWSARCGADKVCRRMKRSCGCASLPGVSQACNPTRLHLFARCATVTSGVAEYVLCVDTGVWIKFLVAEEPASLSDAAAQLVLTAIGSARLIAPAFAWAGVGSVLRQKARQSLVTANRADALWTQFVKLPIAYVDDAALHVESWNLAERFRLPTLDDAAFLACTELAAVPEYGVRVREFWTADEALLRSLEPGRPPYVRLLGRDPIPL